MDIIEAHLKCLDLAQNYYNAHSIGATPEEIIQRAGKYRDFLVSSYIALDKERKRALADTRVGT